MTRKSRIRQLTSQPHLRAPPANPPPEVVNVAAAVAVVALAQGVASTTKGVALVHPLPGKVPRMKVLTILLERRLHLPMEIAAEVVVAVAAVVIGEVLVVIEEAFVAHDGNTTVIALQAGLTRTRRCTNLGAVTRGRQSSRLRLLLPTMPLLNKLLPLKMLPLKNGVPLLVAMPGVLLPVGTPGVPNLAILTGLPLPLRPTRMQKRPPSGLIAVQRTAKRKSKIIR